MNDGESVVVECVDVGEYLHAEGRALMAANRWKAFRSGRLQDVFGWSTFEKDASLL